MFLRFITFFFILGINQNLLADENECTTSTNPIQFSQSDKTQISEQVKQKGTSRVLTFFSNGDLLIASVEDCGLGLELLYFSQFPFESNKERADKLKWLVTLNGGDLASRLPKDELLKPKYNFSVKEEFDGEMHVIKSAKITNATDIFPEIFSESISYIWVPPSGFN